MNHDSIGRLRFSEHRRAYRLPERLPVERISGFDPDRSGIMYDVRRSRTVRTRALRDKLNDIASALCGHDIAAIRAGPSGSFIRFTLMNDARFIDWGNRFERIERVLCDAFDADVEDIDRHPRFKW